MKKIGLAVCYDTKNFGSQLQVLATVKKIEELGYETEIIRYKKKFTPVFIMQQIPRLFNRQFIQNKSKAKKKRQEIAAHEDIARNIKIRNERFDDFVKKHFTNVSEIYNGWENLVKKSNKNYDGFLCGSDQLWLPSNLESHFYTLEFASNNKTKIAYATSFGVNNIPNNQRNRTKKYLNRFEALSTREIAGKKIIASLTEKDAKVVCDPTLLFNAEEWTGFIPDKKVIDEPYVFCYFLGNNEEHREIAEQFKKHIDLKLVTCPFLDNFVQRDQNFGDIQLYDLDAEDFVNLIRHAEYILTDSFHGSVFSILYHKKFMTFNRFENGKNSRNSRIDSLCSLLGLESRRFDGDVFKVKNEVDYLAVDAKQQLLRKESIEYLKNALEMI